MDCKADKIFFKKTAFLNEDNNNWCSQKFLFQFESLSFCPVHVLMDKIQKGFNKEIDEEWWFCIF